MLSFPALRHRNFRLFLTGQGFSLVGTWMQRIALSWLVYRLTHSEFLLGLVGFAGQIPVLGFAPIAGVYADRWDKQKMLLVTQVLSMIQALSLAALVFAGTQAVWPLVALSVVLGIINSFDMPIRQSFVVEMVDGREDLGNAIALNSSMFNFTRLIGPALAGLLIAVTGEGICFLINGLSYIPVIASIIMMRLPRPEKTREPKHWLHELREGAAFFRESRTIRSVLLLLMILSFLGMPYTALMPVFAGDVLKGGSHTLGFLMAASGLGALMGALSMTAKRTLKGLDFMFSLSLAVFGVSLAAFSFSRVLWLSMALMVLTGFGATAFLAAGNTILQTVVDDDKRGRLMSFYTIALMGTFPIGTLIAGSVADRIGAPITVFIGGAGCLAFAFLKTGRMFRKNGAAR